MYRAKPITQRDGSSHANANCGCATAATALDFHTLGTKTSTGKLMRDRNPDQDGGTDWYDMAAAWDTYGETLEVRNGRYWSDAVADLRAGRLVLLSVWHEDMRHVCISGSGEYGHGVAVAPEASGTRWLVSDPWCNPGQWSWVEESDIRRGAETFGAMVYDTTGPDPDLDLLRRVVKALMDRSRPA